jgi:hypothetical protein
MTDAALKGMTPESKLAADFQVIEPAPSTLTV